LGIIIVDFEATSKILIKYSALVKYLKKKMVIQCSSASATYRLEESL